jgi:hypothetical protein
MVADIEVGPVPTHIRELRLFGPGNKKEAANGPKARSVIEKINIISALLPGEACSQAYVRNRPSRSYSATP